VQLGDKADLVKRGMAAHEASEKVTPAVDGLHKSTLDWVDAGIKMADA
jgi:hypothetical protein